MSRYALSAPSVANRVRTSAFAAASSTAVINRFTPFDARDDRGALFENLVVAALLKRNLYARRPFNTYFWRTHEGYEIDLVLENVQRQELWAMQTTTTGKASFSRAFASYQPTQSLVVNLENGYRFCW